MSGSSERKALRMNFMGMDTEQGQEFARLLAERRGDLASRRDEIDGVVQGIDDIWSGPDAERFREKWTGISSGGFEQALERIMDLAREISEHAQEQDVTSAADAADALGEALRDIVRPGNKPLENPFAAFTDWRNYLTGGMGVLTRAGDDMLAMAGQVFAKGGEDAIVPWLRNAYGLKAAGKVLGPVGTVLTGVFAGVDRWNEDAADPTLSTGERATRAVVDGGANVAGALGGAYAGAAAGAAIGSIFPGPGTVIGGVVGGIVGGIVGGGVADAAIDWLLG